MRMTSREISGRPCRMLSGVAAAPVKASVISVGSGKNTLVVFAVLLRSNWEQIPRRCATVRLFSVLPSQSPGTVSSPACEEVSWGSTT